MKLSVGTMLALVTLIGTIWIGGENFGSIRERSIHLQKSVNQINSTIIKITQIQDKSTEDIHKLEKELMKIRYLKTRERVRSETLPYHMPQAEVIDNFLMDSSLWAEACEFYRI